MENLNYLDVHFSDAHWNHNAAYMIPAAWVAIVLDAFGRTIWQARWSDKAGVLEMVKEEFPNMEIPSDV